MKFWIIFALCVSGCFMTYATDVVGGTHVALPTFTTKPGASITATAVNGWSMKSATVDNTASWTAASISGNNASTTYITASTAKFAVTLSGELTPPAGTGSGPVDFSIQVNFSGEFSVFPLKIFTWVDEVAAESFKSRTGSTEEKSYWKADPTTLPELRGPNNIGTATASIGKIATNEQWKSPSVPERYTITAERVSDQATANAELLIVGLTLSIPDESKIIMSPVSMPAIRIAATVLPENTNIKTKFELFPPIYPDGPSYTSANKIISPEIEGNYWDIGFSGNIFGGNFKKIRVHLWVEGKSLGYKDFETNFYVIGDALYKNIRESYIDNVTASNNLRHMTKVIAIQESAGTHFWDGSSGTKGATTHIRYPLKANDNGFGVMQLTSTNLLSVDSVWNWQTNINVGMQYIIQCYNAGVDYLNTGNVTNEMRRLEGYTRYNGGLAARYHRLKNGQWIKYNYINCPKTGAHSSHGATHGYADYDFDGIPDSGYDVGNCKARAELYAEQCLAKEN